MKYNNSFRTIITPLLVAIGIVVGIAVGIRLDRMNIHNRMVRNISSAPRFSNDKISNVISLVKTQYVDNIDLDSIADKVIPEILKNLDPHSVYIPASELAAVNEPLEGQFDGIGVTFNMMTDTILVLNVISGGPSYKAGIQNGDRIVTINDSLVAGKKIRQDDIVKMLRGERGSDVDLGIKRQGHKELIPITVTRGIIPVKSLDAAIMLNDEIGYIKLTRFARNSHRELLDAVEKLKMQGMKELVFDLRDNVGGYMDQAILITNEFLPANSLIVFTEGKSRKRSEQYSNGKGVLKDIPLAVLINENSASASEIFAGAVQDNDRGTIIGRRSFGKGLVQEQIPFPDGSAMRLTVSRYFTPVGRSIQKPYDQGIEAYNNELSDRFDHNEYFSVDSISFADSLQYTTPGGKIVYGGGGIMPDIFVPGDTTGMTDFVKQVFIRNTIVRFSLDYADTHRKELNDISSFGDLDNFFGRHPQLYSDFVKYARRNGVEVSDKEAEESRKVLETDLKAYISRNTELEDNGYYYYIQDIDNVIEESKIFFSQSAPSN
ncbi:MAG: S41 family peptidase [Rikenellaceae bacterium]|nr:S41 family peptidase [Rikenellaceae bacterium]